VLIVTPGAQPLGADRSEECNRLGRAAIRTSVWPGKPGFSPVPRRASSVRAGAGEPAHGHVGLGMTLLGGESYIQFKPNLSTTRAISARDHAEIPAGLVDRFANLVESCRADGITARP